MSLRAEPAPDTFSMTGRVVVVTGASSGIGRHLAAMLDDRGALVVAAARRPDRLEELTAAYPGIVPVVCDVTDPSARERLVEVALERTGRVDVLVNNAGTGVAAPALATTTEAFEATLEVNLSAMFALSAACAQHMVTAGGGSIVSVASILGLVAAHPIPHAAYVAAKGGVVALTRQLGCEWASQGVRVNAIAPGWFPTEVTEDMFADERSMRHLQKNTPMGRVGRLEELDGAVLLLASDAGSFITGQTLTVDGGWTAR